MDILIKDIGMPLMCDECPCYNESDYSCNATGRGVIEYRYDGRPDNCPLVEIPTPHGRLIDADEVKRKMLKFGFRAPDMTKTELLEDEITTIVEAEE